VEKAEKKKKPERGREREWRRVLTAVKDSQDHLEKKTRKRKLYGQKSPGQRVVGAVKRRGVTDRPKGMAAQLI